MIERFQTVLKDRYSFEILDDGADEMHLVLETIPVEIIFNEQDNEMHIFYSVCFPLGKDLETIRENIAAEEELIILYQLLYNSMGIQPTIGISETYGCPFDESTVGYESLVFDIFLLNTFLSVYDSFIALSSAEYLSILQTGITNVPDEAGFLNRLIADKQNIEEAVLFKHAGYHDFDPFKFSISSEPIKNVYISNDRRIILGSCFDSLALILNRLGQPQITADIVYLGINYAIGKTPSGTFLVNSDSIKLFFNLTDRLVIPETPIYLYYENKFLLIQTDCVWIIISTIKDQEHALTEEKALLSALTDSFAKLIPPKPRYKVPWDQINPDNFELLCQEFLELKKFTHARRIGDINSPDGGRDIEAFEAYSTLIGSETRKWIFQCKHQKSVNKAAVGDITGLLKDFDAQAYGLFCSGKLTVQTIERLSTIRTKYHIPIMWWTGGDLERELEKYPELIKKYFSL